MFLIKFDQMKRFFHVNYKSIQSVKKMEVELFIAFAN